MRLTLLFLTVMALRAELIKVEQSFGGIQCASCAKFVKNKFAKNASVESVNIDEKKGLLTLQLKPGNKMKIGQILDFVQQSGYTVKETKVVARGKAIMNKGYASLLLGENDELRVRDPDTVLREFIMKRVEVTGEMKKVESEGQMIDILVADSAKVAAN